MSFLAESKEFLEAIVPGTPEERVQTLIGQKYSFDYHKSAEQLVKLLYPMGLIEEEGQPIDVEAMIARRLQAAKPSEERNACPSLEKLCLAAECFDELYTRVAACVINNTAGGVPADDTRWPVLLRELKGSYQGQRDDEVGILFVYYMVREQGMPPEKAQRLAGFAAPGEEHR